MSDPQTFTAWITDDRLFHTRGGGIRRYSGCADDNGHLLSPPIRGISIYLSSREGKDWHRTREAAVARANDMRNARIASLERQIERLRKMEF